VEGTVEDLTTFGRNTLSGLMGFGTQLRILESDRPSILRSFTRCPSCVLGLSALHENLLNDTRADATLVVT